jgi:integrase
MYRKNPGPGHPSFRLMERHPNKKGYRSVAHPDLDAINREYLSGALTLERAKLLVSTLKDRLEKEKVTPISWLPENMQIAELYIEDKLVPKRSNRRPKAAYDRVRWGVKQLGSTPLIGSTKAQLAEALSFLEPSQERKAVSVVNALLRYKSIPVQLSPPHIDHGDPLYLTIEEFDQVWPELPNSLWQLACKAAFATGARYGELFDMYERSLRANGSHIYISHQVDRHLKRVVTKNKKRGEAYIIPKYRDAVMEWCKVSEADKIGMRRAGAPGKQWQWACLKKLRQPFTFHNLRHSYANYMLKQGASLEDLVVWLRDRASTVESYYANWRLTTDQMKANLNRFG